MESEGGEVVRRLIDADNSCLFNAIGYVMDHSKDKAPELRQIVAAIVSENPQTYTATFLEKPNQEYCEWILNPDHWGGAIELKILSEFYQREIAAYDIQTERCDIYGEGRGYKERVMVIYDGIHYDALALTAFSGAPEEVDQTIFTIDASGSIGPATGMAKALIGTAHVARDFTDTSQFTLRCAVCKQGCVGQKEAGDHAQATGHTDFEEYR